jgi:3-hydroxyisobutyrate dehydrogenase-like beta-hydroxyacid dehydrogenase
VVTDLSGRSEASAARARRAGFEDVGSEAAVVAEAEFILSILPPNLAVDLARRLAPALTAAARKPIYVDCNAVAPATARVIGEVLAATGTPYVDAGIVGSPPGPGRKGPVFYASGEPAAAFAGLAQHGLAIRVLEGGIGAASAMKLSYAGLTKGTAAIQTAMVLGATRAGTAEALLAELAESQPMMLDHLARGLPTMLPKAYRWDGEMEEIAAFLAEDDAASDLYKAIARLYRRIALDVEGPGDEARAIKDFATAGAARAKPKAAE